MSVTIHPSPLHAYIFTRFREMFGEPQNSLQKDDHWVFQGATPGKAINVLVNGTPASPAIWVFDPHEICDPVYSAAVSDELQADQIITLIQGRITRESSINSAVDGGHRDATLPRRIRGHQHP